MEEQDNLLSPIYPGQGTGEVSNLELPTGINKAPGKAYAL